MRLWLISGAAALQLLALMYMAGEREYVVRYGKRIYLRSAPLDPRDLFRGDFVRLRYQANQIPRDRLRDGLRQVNIKRGTKVYASLEQGERGLAEVVSASDIRPHEGTFLRGRTRYRWGRGGAAGMYVQYGLEAYFMQQKTARALEKDRVREGVQVPLEMLVAVGGNGTAVLVDHRWAPLGIGLEIHWQGQGRDRTIQTATVKLLNTTGHDVAIVDLPDAGAFALRPFDRWNTNPWHWVGEAAPLPPLQDADIKVLAPGEVSAAVVDLGQNRWAVQKKGDPAPTVLRDIEDRSGWFRLVYRTPPREACAQLKHADIMIYGDLPSRAFTPGGRID